MSIMDNIVDDALDEWENYNDPYPYKRDDISDQIVDEIKQGNSTYLAKGNAAKRRWFVKRYLEIWKSQTFSWQDEMSISFSRELKGISKD